MKTMLIEVLNDGEKVQLMDGSEWLINPGDLPTVCIWLPSSEIKVEQVNSTGMFTHRLKNLSEGSSAFAMKLN
jgi:hypothetical protein